VIGVDMRFDGKAENQPKLVDKSKIALDVLDDGIDDSSMLGLAIGDDVAAAFRPVVHVLNLVDVQENGDAVGGADCHRMYPENLLRSEPGSAAIVTCPAGLVYCGIRGERFRSGLTGARIFRDYFIRLLNE
jgi:hypothetical protein